MPTRKITCLSKGCPNYVRQWQTTTATSKILCERLHDEVGVAILPGSEFGRPAYELTARMAFVDFDGARALASAEVMSLNENLPADFIDNHCPKVITAIERTCDWLEQ
ncbi:MAG: hypothetical protein RPU59_10890 [Candidatus Sedimenticola sp. (ex Thyasira tokunagai)]